MLEKLFYIYKKLLFSFSNSLSMFISKSVRYEYHYKLFKKGNFKKDILTKEQKKEIDTFYIKNYGKKISYKWHNLFTSYSGKFDVRYIPCDIFLNYLYSLNKKNRDWNMLQDKNFLYNIAKPLNINTPKRFFYSINKLFFNCDNNIISEKEFYKQISNIGEVFIKPTQIGHTGGGNNCRLLNVKDGMDVYSKKSIKDILGKNYNHDFVIQEKIVCHKSISNLYSKSVNTIAVNTLILDNEIKILNPGLKIGMSGSVVDFSGINKSGLLIPIKEDGTLYDYAFCLNENKKYFAHPDTGVVFKNYKIDFFSEILDAAKRLQSAIPWMPFCGWDFVINEKGQVLALEMETPSCHFVQVVFGRGFFEKYTEQILSGFKAQKN